MIICKILAWLSTMVFEDVISEVQVQYKQNQLIFVVLNVATYMDVASYVCRYHGKKYNIYSYELMQFLLCLHNYVNSIAI